MDVLFCRVIFLFACLVAHSYGHKCHRNIASLWLTEAGSSPVVSSPLLADVNGDNVIDVAVTTYDGQVSILNGRTGHEIPGWPFVGIKATYHAAPLLYDIDKDGLMEVLLCTSNGQVIFLKSDGTPVPGQKIIQVPPMKLRKDWYIARPGRHQSSEPRLDAEFANPSEFIPREKNDVEKLTGEDMSDTFHPTSSPPSGLSEDGFYVYVDAHVLSTPVICDFDQDGLEHELAVPVNFYFDQTMLSTYPKDSRLPAKDLENYLGSGIVVFNLDTGLIIYKTVLEVTKRSSLYPGYILSLPTVLDNSSVVIGTLAGNIFIVKRTEDEPKLLTTMDSIQGQISVADANDDGHLELLTIDDSGNVACIDLSGKRIWETTVSGSPASGIRVADINGDNLLDVVFATYDGYLWVLNGNTGKVLSGWPVKLPGELRATVMVTKLRPGDGPGLDIVIPLLDGTLTIIRGSDHCAEFIEMGIPGFSSAVAANLLPWKQGLEIVVGNSDGSVICLGDATNRTASHSIRSDIIQEDLFSWKAETRSCSGTTFYSGKVGVAFTESTRESTHHKGSSFLVEFEITDFQAADLRWNNYRTKIFIGNKMLVLNKTVTTPGVHQEVIPVPPHPGKVVIVIKMMTPNEQCFQDSFHISFNTNQLGDLHWYLLAPFMTMSCLLLVLYGHAPPGELLPTIMRKR